MKEQPFSCFVGHIFDRKQIDDLRRAIRESFTDYPAIKLWYADEYLTPGHILEKIKEGIDTAILCIFEMSNQTRANVFLEFGYTVGKGKPWILLLERGQNLPSDLSGYDRIEYESMIDLTNRLKTYLPSVIGNALKSKLHKNNPERAMYSQVIICLEGLKEGDVIRTSDLIKHSVKWGANDLQVRDTLEEFEASGWISRQGDISVITSEGASVLDKLIEMAKKNLPK